ncbi:unnamed protein product [Diplocarpon coronariae]
MNLWRCIRFSRSNHHSSPFSGRYACSTYKTAVNESTRIESVPIWFEGVHLSFAENLLYSRVPGTSPAVRGKVGQEDEKVGRRLRRGVRVLASTMRARMVGKQDLVVVVASNSVDTLKIYLAATTLSGLLGSSSADMGVQSGLQRALQVTPKQESRPPWQDAPHGGWNEDVVEFRGMVSMPLFSDLVDINKVSRTQILAPYFPKALSRVRDFEPKAFHAPSFIAYSSGRREPQSVSYSPPVVVSSHLPRRKAAQGVDSESDGSPFQPDIKTFVLMVGEHEVTKLVVSPRLRTVVCVREVMRRGSSRRVAYRIFIDTLKTPFTPVYVDDTQGPCLGAPVGVCNDLIEGGKGIPGSLPPHGKPGELAAPAAFPNMPVYVWNDPSGSTYFVGTRRLRHDLLTKVLFFFSRADEVLNPSGLQSGSAKVSPIVKEKFSVLAIVSARAREGRSKGRVAPHAILVNEAQRKIHADVFADDSQLGESRTPHEADCLWKKIITPNGTLLNPQSLGSYYQFAKMEVAERKSRL